MSYKVGDKYLYNSIDGPHFTKKQVYQIIGSTGHIVTMSSNLLPFNIHLNLLKKYFIKIDNQECEIIQEIDVSKQSIIHPIFDDYELMSDNWNIGLPNLRGKK